MHNGNFYVEATKYLKDIGYWDKTTDPKAKFDHAMLFTGTFHYRTVTKRHIAIPVLILIHASMDEYQECPQIRRKDLH
ncbi:hypothetical protein CHS0354_011102 [Potamilus streckersoni]|uniref:Uncharacterized protein n=1 Tax=Potamilus streckersoni TaxID=2493646 RepID=A0AAE0TC26_9BIVA|nr:hypothetical protein CHS0354_011102 [Potamilus streckersoni]